MSTHACTNHRCSATSSWWRSQLAAPPQSPLLETEASTFGVFSQSPRLSLRGSPKQLADHERAARREHTRARSR